MVLIGAFLAGSNNAEAMLCELDIGDSQLMSTVADAESKSPERLFQRTKVSDGSAALECNSLGIDNCDINLPGGEPQPTSTPTPVRPSAAIPQKQGQLIAPPRARPLYYLQALGPKAGHYPNIYRPPRQ
jgi:hypothetical protein